MGYREREPGLQRRSNETSGLRRRIAGFENMFHPGSAAGGPDLYEIQNDRRTIQDGQELHTDDLWNHWDGQQLIGSRPWTGQTVFYKKGVEKGKKEVINEKFLQNQRLASQGGFITFFYDERMEVEESQPFQSPSSLGKATRSSGALLTPCRQNAKR